MGCERGMPMFGLNKLKSLTKIFQSAEEIAINDSSKIIIMSDCHRGDGSWADNFSKNQNIYFVALSHYYDNGYTYIELGDGDELWENRDYTEIMREHDNVFWLLVKFINADRFYSLYGNHDMAKKKNLFKVSRDYKNYDERDRVYLPLFERIKFHNGLILRNNENGQKIFLVHGHQVDYLNDNLWKLSRFLVRYLWRTLEVWGVNDPTSAAKNYDKKAGVEKKLVEWVEREKQMLIAGHTHRPVFPTIEATPYFNDGSCVHPRCITGIEIVNGTITLIKWSIVARKDGTLAIDRDILAGPEKLTNYMQK